MHIVVLILVYLPEEKRAFICTFGLPCFLRPSCHLGPAKLNPYEPASSNRNAADSQHLCDLGFYSTSSLPTSCCWTFPIRYLDMANGKP
jgi:hypothetical protein